MARIWADHASQADDSPLVAWDIGANVGYHLLFLASTCDWVMSIEPIPCYAMLLREKVTFNEIGTVALQEVAVGEEAGEIALHY